MATANIVQEEASIMRPVVISSRRPAPHRHPTVASVGSIVSRSALLQPLSFRWQRDGGEELVVTMNSVPITSGDAE